MIILVFITFTQYACQWAIYHFNTYLKTQDLKEKEEIVKSILTQTQQKKLEKRLLKKKREEEEEEDKGEDKRKEVVVKKRISGPEKSEPIIDNGRPRLTDLLLASIVLYLVKRVTLLFRKPTNRPDGRDKSIVGRIEDQSGNVILAELKEKPKKRYKLPMVRKIEVSS